jgi:hypothetical protein
MAAPCGKQLKAFLYGEAVDKIMALLSFKVKLSLSNFLHCQTMTLMKSYFHSIGLVLSLFLNNLKSLLFKKLIEISATFDGGLKAQEEAVFNSFNTQHHMYHLFFKCLTLSRSSLDFYHVSSFSLKLDNLLCLALMQCNIAYNM